MNATVKKIESILKSPYDTKNYIDFVNELFPGMTIVAPDKFMKEYTNFSSHIEGAIHIGNYETSDNRDIVIFAVELKKANYVEGSRSTQRSYAKKIIENAGADAAFIAYYTPDDPKWRISLVRLEYEMKFENGKLKAAENITPAKRYSYLVGKDEPCHTAISRFKKFIVDGAKEYAPSLEELEEAFSVEKVTNEFFELYRDKFVQLVEELEANEDFMIEAEHHNYTSAQFAKKLMGQIVFLYFLQKKGWLGVNALPKVLTEKEYKHAFFARGAKSRQIVPIVYRQDGDVYRLYSKGLQSLSDDEEEILANSVKGAPWGSGPHNFMRTLFNYAITKKLNYFDDVLEPLFYDALNVNRGEQGYCPALHCRIPFLSGGLFEPIDGYDWKHNDFAIPNEVFSNVDEKGVFDADGILDIFDRYNFTMSEDEPMEREVAIDPEMLGKVFENLLDVTDRKSKGAFYTPREIVHYMCQESLINYLVKVTSISEPAIREFILHGDLMKDEDTIKEKRQGNGGMYISEEIYKMGVNGEVQVNRLKDIDEALRSVRVADPAVGSGAFPLGMLNEIVRARQNISAYMSITMNAYQTRMMYSMERSPYALKHETIKNCIFAADIEPSAVDIAQLRLWLSLVIDDEINPYATNPVEGHKNPIPLPNLECNIVCGNSLIEEFEGVKLINNGLVSNQIDANTERYIVILNQIIKKQKELFSCDDTYKKKLMLEEISSLKEILISTQFEGQFDEKKNRFKELNNCASKPFVLWELDFASVFQEKGGFDIILGNPPYVDSEEMSRSMPEMRELYSKLYNAAKGNWDLYIPFWEKSVSMLNDIGNATLITPNKWLAIKYGHALRNLLFEYIYNISDYSRFYAFESADVSTVVVMISKIPSDTIRVNKFNDRYVLTKSDICEKKWIEEYDNISLCLSDNYKTLFEIIKYNKLDDFFLVKGAATVSETYEIAKIVEDVENPNSEEFFKFINTGTIDKFKSLWGIEEMTYVKQKYLNPVVSRNNLLNLYPRRFEQANAPKLITTGIRYLEVFGDFEGEYLAAKSTEIITSKSDLSLKALLPILNSSVVFFFIKEAYGGLAMGGGITFSPDNLSKIPIPVLSADQILALEKCCEKFSSNFDSQNQDELDELIYRIYDLDQVDIECINNFKLKNRRKR